MMGSVQPKHPQTIPSLLFSSTDTGILVRVHTAPVNSIPNLFHTSFCHFAQHHTYEFNDITTTLNVDGAKCIQFLAVK